MDSTKLLNLIDDLDSQILEYTNRFNLEKANLVLDLKDDYIITNERTLSSFSNNQLVGFFNEKYFKNVSLMVDEFHIKLKNKTKIYQESLEIEVDNYSRKKNWLNCYVDGYFKIENLYFQGINHLFIEYKMQSKFIFADLATDFLKYKIYTSVNEKNTIFSYIIFDKNDKWPRITIDKHKKFVLINKSISKKELEISRVYLYIPKDAVSLRESERSELIMKLFELFSEFNTFSNDYSQLDENELRDYTSLEKCFLNNSNKYNTKVFTSNLIKDNYPFIYKVWLESNRLGVFDEFKKSVGFVEGDIDIIEKIILEGSNYLSNFEENLGVNDKINATEKGLRVSYYSSFLLLVLIDYFSVLHGLKVSPPKYGKVLIGKKNSGKTIDYESIAKQKKEELHKIYSSEIGKINKLTFGVLLFLTNIFPILFVIDANNNVLNKTINNQLRGLLEKMQDKLNKIFSLLEYKNKFKLLFNQETEEELNKLFMYIINNIEKTPE